MRTFTSRVLCCLTLVAAAALAQSFLGSISGTVTDASDAILQQAKVVLTETKTGVQRTTTANASGEYSFADLAPGTYSISVSAAGFKEAKSGDIILTAQRIARFDARLEVGESSQSVSVQAVAATLNTENAQLGDLRPRADLLTLPNNTRSAISFFFLSSFNYQGDGSSYSLGGLRGTNTNFTIDGVSSNSNIFGNQVGPMTEESLESVAELKMLSSNNAAEFPGVGTIMIASRAGTNALHGGAYYYQSNWAFNARNFFSPTKPKGPIAHQFGGSIGGPVYIPRIYNGHNRTFFNVSWEQSRNPGGYNGTANVPTQKMLTGDFSGLLPKTVIRDPSTGLPFPGNIIPASRISPVSLKIQQFGFLPPNFGSQDNFSANWRGFFPTSSYDDKFVVRGDHQLSAKDTLSARASFRFIPLPMQFDASLPMFVRNQTRQTRNDYISETHIFSPSVVNEARIGFARDYSKLAGVHSGADVVTQFGLQGINLSNKAGLAGVPNVTFVNFSNMYEYPTYYWLGETYELLDNITLIKGKHRMKAGFLIRDNRPAISEQPSSDFGTLGFNGFATGFDYSDFLLGIPQSTGRYDRAVPSSYRWLNVGVFFQDDYQISRKLTLNLGLRYEYFQPPVDTHDLRFAFDPTTGNLIVPNQRVLTTQVSPVFPKNIPIVTAQTAGYPSRSLVNPDHKDFGPRIGLAYRPFPNNKTVIRTGYGIFYSGLVSPLLGAFSGGPYHSNEQFTNAISSGAPLFQFPNPFPGVGTVPSQSISPSSRYLKTPYTQQWNLTLERELGGGIVLRGSYRGIRTDRIPFSANINKPFPSANLANANFYTYPQFANVSLVQDGGIQKLHAVDLGIERKFAAGLTFQAGWTWGKNLSDVGNDGESASIENPYDRRREMADVDFMPRHRFTSQVVYQIPLGGGRGPAIPKPVELLLGNWQVSAVTVFQTGQFLTPSFSGSDPSNTRTTSGRPDRTSNAGSVNQSINLWFNPSDFAVPPIGRFGNSARGVIIGPGLANINFGLYRNFKMIEKATLQLRMTATNFFNHPNFANPNTNISSTVVGTITGLQGGRFDTLGAGPRVIQIGARIDF
jgi:hypothetical protein